MSHWKTIRTIAVFEFVRLFKWKQELAGLLIMAAMIGIINGWGALKNSFAEEHSIAVVSERSLPPVDGINWQQIELSQASEIKQNWDPRFDGLLVIKDNYSAELIAPIKASWQETVSRNIRNWLQAQKLADMPLNAQQVALLNQPIRIDRQILNETDDPQKQAGRRMLPTMMLVGLMVGVFTGFGLMMTSITQEKQQRVTEQLLTLVTPAQWMDGKIAGITLHCLKSILTIIVIIFLVSATVSAVGGGPIFIPSINLAEALNAVLFVLLGLLMINSFLAGFSATIDDPNHSSRTSMMMLPGLLVAAGFSVMEDPQSLFAQVLSIFPLTSFAVMPIRFIEGGVPWWQWLASLALLLLTVWLIRSAAIRLFTLGIRMYGKEPSWKDLGGAFIGR